MGSTKTGELEIGSGFASQLDIMRTRIH